MATWISSPTSPNYELVRWCHGHIDKKIPWRKKSYRLRCCNHLLGDCFVPKKWPTMLCGMVTWPDLASFYTKYRKNLAVIEKSKQSSGNFHKEFLVWGWGYMGGKRVFMGHITCPHPFFFPNMEIIKASDGLGWSAVPLAPVCKILPLYLSLDLDLVRRTSNS